ncbi:MAG: hypothetical protein QOE87_677 [Gaiellales bacterium]|nr:hypothetical protein [Gaiellales bacterium]
MPAAASLRSTRTHPATRWHAFAIVDPNVAIEQSAVILGEAVDVGLADVSPSAWARFWLSLRGVA